MMQFGLAIAVLLFLTLNGGQAHAWSKRDCDWTQDITKESFWDYEWAKSQWQSIQTNAAMTALEDQYYDAFDAMMLDHNYRAKPARKWLAQNRKSDAARGADATALIQVWCNMYDAYYRGMIPSRKHNWRLVKFNDMVPRESKICRRIIRMNPFGKTCDMPEWRTEKMLKKEERLRKNSAKSEKLITGPHSSSS